MLISLRRFQGVCVLRFGSISLDSFGLPRGRCAQTCTPIVPNRLTYFVFRIFELPTMAQPHPVTPYEVFHIRMDFSQRTHYA